MAPHVRTVKTASGALAVQIVYSNRKGSRDIEHIGSAHDDAELELGGLAIGRRIEDTTGWSIKRFAKTMRRYRTIDIQAGNHTITAADPLPNDLAAILETIKTRATAH